MEVTREMFNQSLGDNPPISYEEFQRMGQQRMAQSQADAEALGALGYAQVGGKNIKLPRSGGSGRGGGGGGIKDSYLTASEIQKYQEMGYPVYPGMRKSDLAGLAEPSDEMGTEEDDTMFWAEMLNEEEMQAADEPLYEPYEIKDVPKEIDRTTLMQYRKLLKVVPEAVQQGLEMGWDKNKIIEDLQADNIPQSIIDRAIEAIPDEIPQPEQLAEQAITPEGELQMPESLKNLFGGIKRVEPNIAGRPILPMWQKFKERARGAVQYQPGRPQELLNRTRAQVPRTPEQAGQMVARVGQKVSPAQVIPQVIKGNINLARKTLPTAYQKTKQAGEWIGQKARESYKSNIKKAGGFLRGLFGR